MKTFEFKSQICTTKEQSERLLALGLKKETADMVWMKELAWDEVAHCTYDAETYMLRPIDYLEGESHRGHIHAWSLHRLLFLIPKEVNIDGFKFPLRSDVIMRLEDLDYIYERLIGIIERVIEQGFINQDYLEERK